MKCSTCGHNLREIPSVGSRGIVTCTNSGCPSKHQSACPKCGSRVKSVDGILIQGLGDCTYKCSDCGNVWNTIEELRK